MNKSNSSNQGTTICRQTITFRRAELIKHHWSRNKSIKIALDEGIQLNDEHWAVIIYLRRHYLEHGLPRHARQLAQKLNRRFKIEGGSKYLHNLFPGGPITQGSRFANTRLPDNASDCSFGTCY